MLYEIFVKRKSDSEWEHVDTGYCDTREEAKQWADTYREKGKRVKLLTTQERD